MTGTSTSAPAGPHRLGADLAAVALVFAAYTATVWVARNLTFGEALACGAANTVPVVIFGAAARRIIVKRLAGRGLLTQLVGHAALCAAFAALSFWLLLVLLGLASGASLVNFSVRAFSIQGSAWQLLEEVTTYAVLAAWTYAQLGASVPKAQLSAGDAEAPQLPRETEPSRYFVRNGEDIRPVDLDRVVCIGGADDYSEVTTLDGVHLVRMTLSDFERTLDPTKFARVHRSWIVNLDRIERAEPAGGGRLLLHMKTGHTVPASRSGARSVRDLVI
jgi:two-component system, LytTR family, response regulator